jgi:NAD(P)-dependent dehydrogenase (short-subunit alcohol dehydrogenase family)
MPGNLVELAVKSFGRLDGLVINHSVLDPKKLADVTPENFKYVYDVNVFSCFAVVWVPPESQNGRPTCEYDG